MSVTEAVYGSWKSPLSSKLACDSSVSIKRLYVDPQTPDVIYWSELRPKENGGTYVFSKNVKKVEVDADRWTSSAFNAKDTVHEYGGAAFFVSGGSVYFSNHEDNKMYVQSSVDNVPKSFTTGPEKYYRYADGEFFKDNLMFSIREDHSVVSPDVKDPENTVVSIDITTGEEVKLVSGNDFYSNPHVSPDGSKLTWMTWKHPNMPWDNTEIWVADIIMNEHKVSLANERKVAGEDGVNFMEPRWNSDNQLMYISDKTGWWNLYVIKSKKLDDCSAENIYQVEKEIGGPCWEFGNCSYSPHPKNKNLVAVLYGSKPSILNSSSGKMEDIDIGNFSALSCLFEPANGKYLYINVVSPIQPGCILRYDVVKKTHVILHQSATLDDNIKEYLSIPEEVTFPVDNGAAVAYGYYYAPKNKVFKAPDGTLPPVLCKIHGGPTGSASLAMDLGKQYFTTRGIGILDINYRGSTGYGTSFRNALKDNWGVHDIEDACAGASCLANDKKVADKTKLLISGGSAGGYTALACLTFRSVFRTGASYYGISDLSALAQETHKFESHYCDTMVGEYLIDGQKNPIYDERSPIKHLKEFVVPCAYFQGKLDRVVPPNQSELMFNSIKDKGLPCSYVLFPDEAHGFQKSENKQKSLDGEFYFYSQILGFTAADTGIEIPIENL